MKIVATGFGVLGDILPTLAIGWELTRRGHSVSFVGNPYFAKHAATAGVSFSAVGEAADHERMMADADLFDRSRKSNEQALAEHYFPHLGQLYRAISEACEPAPDAMLGMGEIASRSVAEKLDVPYVLVGPSPLTAMFASRRDPPHPERTLHGWARWFAASASRLALYYLLMGAARRVRHPRKSAPPGLPDDHPVARLRTSVGLSPLPRRTPHRILCMWPEWFAPPQPDWPKQAAIAGFPFWPRPSPSASGSPPNSSGIRPIVVTTGSAAAGQNDFYAAAVAACTALGRPAILVTPHKEHIPRDLPPGVSHVEFAPFEELLGRASLLLHHGGIGTASYALAAGIPQIIMPMRGDQFDNANRLARLGVAAVLPGRNVSPERLAGLIRKLADSAQVQRQCQHWRSRIDHDQGLRRAADFVEQLA